MGSHDRLCERKGCDGGERLDSHSQVSETRPTRGHHHHHPHDDNGDGDGISTLEKATRLGGLGAKVFTGSLGALVLVDALLSSRTRGKRSRHGGKGLLLGSLYKNLPISLFLSLYPVLFRLINILAPHELARHDGGGLLLLLSRLARSPALVLGVLAMLVPPAWMSQFNLYTITGTLMAVANLVSRGIDRRATPKLRVERHDSQETRTKRRGSYTPYWMKPESEQATTTTTTTHASELNVERVDAPRQTWDLAQLVKNTLASGGCWWMFALTQGVLLDMAVFEPDCFPTTYRNVIIARSQAYVPRPRQLVSSPVARSVVGSNDAKGLPSPRQLFGLLPVFASSPTPHPAFPLPPSIDAAAKFAPFETLFRVAHHVGGHDKSMCAVLHPLEPRCGVHFVNAVKQSLPSALMFVGGYSGLVTLIKWNTLVKE